MRKEESLPKEVEQAEDLHYQAQLRSPSENQQYACNINSPVTVA
jgi:hypothetical protein